MKGNGAQIMGNFIGTLAERVEMTKMGILIPVVTGSYRLEEANEVLTKLERGEIMGRAVLVP